MTDSQAIRAETLRELIVKSRGTVEMESHSKFKLPPRSQILIDTAKNILSSVPPLFGACAMLSAGWAALLRDHHHIPAIAVAGNLSIHGTTIFKCTKNLPEAGKSGKVISEVWDGHCWLEIDGVVGDLSIFRTAYAIKGTSRLKEFILANFGEGKGALLCPENQLHSMGMEYEPKYVLNEPQINGLVAGLSTQIIGHT